MSTSCPLASVDTGTPLGSSSHLVLPGASTVLCHSVSSRTGRRDSTARATVQCLTAGQQRASQISAGRLSRGRAVLRGTFLCVVCFKHMSSVVQPMTQEECGHTLDYPTLSELFPNKIISLREHRNLGFKLSGHRIPVFRTLGYFNA